MILELVRYFLERLVSKPELLSIKLVEMGDKNIIEVRVSAQDLQKVTGNEGSTFKALRALLFLSKKDNIQDIVIDIAQ